MGREYSLVQVQPRFRLTMLESPICLCMEGAPGSGKPVLGCDTLHLRSRVVTGHGQGGTSISGSLAQGILWEVQDWLYVQEG